MKEVTYTEAMYNICCGLDIHKSTIIVLQSHFSKAKTCMKR